MPPKKTLWRLQPHTRGKHAVLEYYLKAWLPILGSGSDRIIFIDGFAGPGYYSEGEEGSPIIALRTFCEHRSREIINAAVGFFFIESRPDRAECLEQVIAEWEPDLPDNCRVKVKCGKFDSAMTEVLDRLEEQHRTLAPAFVMIDPFGVSDTPMDVIKRILENPKSEVFITFMYESISRFSAAPEFARHLDNLFGCPRWRKGLGIAGPDKKDFFYGLYEQQLREAGARYVLHFDLYEEKRLIYGIFFATNNLTGCDKMKQAIWKVAPFGNFAFYGTRSRQLMLNLAATDFEPLKHSLRQEFLGQGWVSISDIQDFICSDRSDYHSGHLKRSGLRPMENSGQIEVKESSRRKKLTYPPGTLIRFI